MNLICFPDDTSPHRYALGHKGDKNLLVVGLNPSTATSENHDPTSRNIETIANNNGYDGWLLVNLYSLRTSDPSDLPVNISDTDLWNNLNNIKKLLVRDQFKFDTVWLAWGSSIEYLGRDYLLQSICYLYRILKDFNLRYVCIGSNIGGHPTHPSPMAIAKKHNGKLEQIKFKRFDYQDYNFHLSHKVRLEPEIKINLKGLNNND